MKKKFLMLPITTAISLMISGCNMTLPFFGVSDASDVVKKYTKMMEKSDNYHTDMDISLQTTEKNIDFNLSADTCNSNLYGNINVVIGNSGFDGVLRRSIEVYLKSDDDVKTVYSYDYDNEYWTVTDNMDCAEIALDFSKLDADSFKDASMEYDAENETYSVIQKFDDFASFCSFYGTVENISAITLDNFIINHDTWNDADVTYTFDKDFHLISVSCDGCSYSDNDNAIDITFDFTFSDYGTIKDYDVTVPDDVIQSAENHENPFFELDVAGYASGTDEGDVPVTASGSDDVSLYDYGFNTVSASGFASGNNAAGLSGTPGYGYGSDGSSSGISGIPGSASGSDGSGAGASGIPGSSSGSDGSGSGSTGIPGSSSGSDGSGSGASGIPGQGTGSDGSSGAPGIPGQGTGSDGSSSGAPGVPGQGTGSDGNKTGAPDIPGQSSGSSGPVKKPDKTEPENKPEKTEKPKYDYESPAKTDKLGSYSGINLTAAGDPWDPIFGNDDWEFVDTDGRKYTFMSADNSKYPDAVLYVYNKNKTDVTDTDIKKNGCYGYDIDCRFSSAYPDMTWNGITFGANAYDVLNAYGEPDYTYNGGQYTMYQYKISDDIKMEFSVSSSKGLMRVSVTY